MASLWQRRNRRISTGSPSNPKWGTRSNRDTIARQAAQHEDLNLPSLLRWKRNPQLDRLWRGGFRSPPDRSRWQQSDRPTLGEFFPAPSAFREAAYTPVRVAKPVSQRRAHQRRSVLQYRRYLKSSSSPAFTAFPAARSRPLSSVSPVVRIFHQANRALYASRYAVQPKAWAFVIPAHPRPDRREKSRSSCSKEPFRVLSSKDALNCNFCGCSADGAIHFRRYRAPHRRRSSHGICGMNGVTHTALTLLPPLNILVVSAIAELFDVSLRA